MSFDPKSNEELVIDGTLYLVQGHPSFDEIPYGQEGRQGTVYKLSAVQDGHSKALKVFKPAFRSPSHVYLSDQFRTLHRMEGLHASNRTILTPQKDMELLSKYPDLLYAALMPWINGPTWMDILLEKQELTMAASLHTAISLAEVLSYMEQRGLAHGDLSAPNVMIPGLLHDITPTVKSWIQLIDIEQMYAAHFDRPDFVSLGSSGYSSRRSDYQQLWNKYADRFAGSVLLAEMLAWFHPDIRERAWGESYFDPERMHNDTERVELLLSVLLDTYGYEVEGLFRKAWDSEALHQCPTFGEWFITLSAQASKFHPSENLLQLHSEAPRMAIERLDHDAPSYHTDSNRTGESRLSGSKTDRAVPQAEDGDQQRRMEHETKPINDRDRVHERDSRDNPADRLERHSIDYPEKIEHLDDRQRLALARDMERRGDLKTALQAYTEVLKNIPQPSSIRYEVEIAIASISEALAAQLQFKLESTAEPLPNLSRRKPNNRKNVFIAAAAVIVLVGASVTTYGLLHKRDEPKQQVAALENQHKTPTEDEQVQQVERNNESKQPTPVISSTQESETDKESGNAGTGITPPADTTTPPVDSTVKNDTKQQATSNHTEVQPQEVRKLMPVKPNPPASSTVKSSNASKPKDTTTEQTSSQQQITSLEEAIQSAFHVEDDTEKVIKLSKQLLKLDSNNEVAKKMLADLTGAR